MATSSARFIASLGLKYPILQSPMAGVTTPKMVAEVINFGAMGSLPVSHCDLNSCDGRQELRNLIQEVQSGISKESAKRNINLNFFCYDVADTITDIQKQNWYTQFEKVTKAPINRDQVQFKNRSVSFKEYEKNNSFRELLNFFENYFTPKVVSFHFGHPLKESLDSLQSLGIQVFVTATSVQEFKLLIDLGVDGIVCQGYEAGGHRGSFLELDERLDENLSTEQLLKRVMHLIEFGEGKKPFIIPSGGLCNSEDIKYVLSQGASAAQLGTVFLATPESKTAMKFKKLISENGYQSTTMTSIVSGKSARAISTPFLRDLALTQTNEELPYYSYRYNAFKILRPHIDEADFILAGQGFLSVDISMNIHDTLQFLVKGL